MEDFSWLETIWEHHTAVTNRFKRFPKHLDDSFLVRVPREMTQKNALLDLLLVHRVDLMVTGAVLDTATTKH